jgi:Leucine-rich repeat (LRR) protein
MLQSIKNAFIGLLSLRKLKLFQNKLHHFESFAEQENSNVILKNYLDLSGNCLKSIRFKTTQFSALSFLDLSYNLIEVIAKSDFEFLRSIEIFNISNNYLKLFEISSNVEIFVLNMSNISMLIDLGLFESSNRIVSLDLSSNKITSSFFNLSDYLPYLTHLRLRNSHILNESLSQIDFLSFLRLENLQLDNVQGLRIDMNWYSVYESSSCLYSQIKSLILSNQGLKQVDWIKFLKLNETIEIDLSHNQISVIKAQSFKAMIYLQRLNLSFNRIVEIQKGAFIGLNVLDYIDLRHNDLKQIDSNDILARSHLFGSNLIQYVKIMKNLDLLAFIDYSHNNLMSFEMQTKIESASFLQTLYLDHNLLTNITSKYFNLLSNLQKIRLDNNQICSIEKNSFQSSDPLEYLTLNNNRLDHLDIELFKFMRSMKHLNLSWNRLSFIHKELFSYMIDLRELDLSNNLIYQIDDYAFSALIRLTMLYLNKNENLTLNESSLSGLSSIKVIHLSFSSLLNRNNLKYLTRLLRPRWSKTIHSRKYYESIFIQYFFDNSFNQSESFTSYECKLIILFFKFNLNLNLKNEQLYSLFVKNCLKMKLLVDDLNLIF